MSIHQLLKFKPILKEKIWGGTKLKTKLNKDFTETNIGESWEVSDVQDNISLVVNGSLAGQNLQELITTFTTDLLGEAVYTHFGNKFPLLIKFIDAKESLSIQVHPNDSLANQRHNSFGKTEMWYVIQADKEANLIVGFKEKVTKKNYLKHLENKTLLKILNVAKVSQGDVYFIPAGRVHAIGAGVLLAEIQQTSDITYRIYDWDRPNFDGSFRDLHTTEALDAMDYSVKESYKTTYIKEQNSAKKIVSCPYFTTNILPVNGVISINTAAKNSFVIYMCVKGNVKFTYNNQQEILQTGETILVPACIETIEISAEENSELLEVYIQ